MKYGGPSFWFVQQGRDFVGCGLSRVMRILLTLADPSSRNPCHDYFSACGHAVDAAADVAQSKSFLRFREYDLLLADLPFSEPARSETLALMEFARRRSSTFRILMTTAEADATLADETLAVVTKPQSLRSLVALAEQRRSHKPRRGISRIL